MKLESTIKKVDTQQRCVYGWASVLQDSDNGHAPLVDSQGDRIHPAMLEKAVVKFMQNSRRGGVMHESTAGEVIESCVLTEEKQNAMFGKVIAPVGWWVGVRINESREDVWQQVLDGTLKMFSIHGKAQRVAAEEAP